VDSPAAKRKEVEKYEEFEEFEGTKAQGGVVRLACT
jgi:hypothetical protein